VTFPTIEESPTSMRSLLRSLGSVDRRRVLLTLGPPLLGSLVLFVLAYRAVGPLAAVAAALLGSTAVMTLQVGVLIWMLRKQVASAQRKVTAVHDQLSREMRYIVDMVVDVERPPRAEAGTPLASYALERHAKHRKVVAFARAVEESRIRELFLAEIFLGIEQVAIPIGAINELTGHVNKVDMLYVCAIARHIGARRIFEFGTYQGRTTYHLTFAADGAHVTTLNLAPAADPRYAPHLGRYFRGTDREAFITQVYCDSREFDTTPHRRQFDFVFVDGDHSYEVVENDTMKAFELLRPGGVIVWHDYAPKSAGLVRFFRDFTQTRPLFRIKRTCLLVHVDGVDPMSFQPHAMAPSLERDLLDGNAYWIEEIYHA
jgi:predicted O-methyltransferase YrrM